MGKEFPSRKEADEERERLFRERKDVPALLDTEKPYWKILIDFYYRMGYDYAPVSPPSAPITVKSRVTKDTAILSRGNRSWVEEKEGVITTWEELEAFPWNRINLPLRDFFSFVNENLPAGMKITVGSSLYETVGERLLGWECMFRNLYLDPDLVKEVFNRRGEIVYNNYKEAVSHDCVGAIFHADDLGYKKGTMIKPNMLKEIVFPWFKKYVSLAHEYGKLFLYHCCGNVSAILDDLIEDVGVDGFHSFQDVIMPVWEFKEKYGDRVAVLGGVDVDKLARYDQRSLRKYVRSILARCVPGGRYALGSGNTITNYVPPENYVAMIEEGQKWKPNP
jgi:uroporphyrinogen decarboxylase